MTLSLGSGVVAGVVAGVAAVTISQLADGLLATMNKTCAGLHGA